MNVLQPSTRINQADNQVPHPIEASADENGQLGDENDNIHHTLTRGDPLPGISIESDLQYKLSGLRKCKTIIVPQPLLEINSDLWNDNHFLKKTCYVLVLRREVQNSQN
jgi:hypothetical protein